MSDCTLEDFQKAITSADKAQRIYFETTTGATRGALLRRWNDLILENLDDRKHNAPALVCPRLMPLTDTRNNGSCYNHVFGKRQDFGRGKG